MRHKLLCSLAAIALLGAGQSVVGQGANYGPNGSGRWTVVFKSATLPPNAAALIATSGGRVERSVAEIGVLTASGNAAFATRLAKNSDVLAVGREHFYKLPDVQVQKSDTIADTVDESPATIGTPQAIDSYYRMYEWNVRRIGAPAMWARVPLEVQRTATVAVLDTGVMHTHPDLVGQIVRTEATNYCPESFDGNPAYPIYATLIDFDAHPEWDPSMGCAAADTVYHSHGTHVSGIVAARFGGARAVGVAPGVGIAAYKVFDRYRYTVDDEVVDDVGAFDGPLFSAIVDAALSGYQVINMSLGSTIDRSRKEDNASWLAWDRVAKFADRLGTTIVTSAGNEAQNSNGTIAHLPSDLPTVMSTSATGTNNLIAGTTGWDAAPGSDVLAYYSNYGAATDIAAPGGDCGPGFPETCFAEYFIFSLYIFESGPNAGLPGYAWMAGTSMAAPHVAAVAAVVKALHPDWTPGEVRSYVKETAEKIGSRQAFGLGLVSADAASR